MAIDALLLTVDALKSLGTDRYRVLITLIPPRPSSDGDQARKLLQSEQIPLFSTGIRRFAAHQKASSEGVVVHSVRDERAADAWSDYAAIGSEVLE